MIYKDSKTLRAEARETFKVHYWNIFIVNLLIS